ncbi:hypothetical protein [Xenorhabdus indica]|uniref:hypothetical protein n=1 Tax=Xenorhabdus indica TaxID=333964 RepID=UPI001FE44D6B|nr:hypothetical protein [Xenorhabdus indica]
MLDWLETHVGTTWATYQGWILGLIGVVLTACGFFATKKRPKNDKSKQITKNVQGDSYQANRDINNIAINNPPSSDEKNEHEKQKKNHDLKIIEDILTLLPYEETIYRLENSHIVGIPLKFSMDLEKIEKFTDEKYRLYNNTVNAEKDNLVNATTKFLSSTNFLHVDHPDKEPHRLDLPHDWKNNPENEAKFRKCQSDMNRTSKILIECYKSFVKTFKEQEFITDKI